MHKVKLLMVEEITHDVRRFITEKPSGYNFTPGHATEVAINQGNWKEAKRPFTFTSLKKDKVLQFVIKSYDPAIYEDHDGMTQQLRNLKPGDELLIDDPWGTIEYKDRGVFIAAGAGITPFLAIFKDLALTNTLQGNKLIYSNKTTADIIYHSQLTNWFKPSDLILTLTREQKPGYEHGRVDEAMLKRYIADFNQSFYVCGPPPFVKGTRDILEALGASPDTVVFEK